MASRRDFFRAVAGLPRPGVPTEPAVAAGPPPRSEPTVLPSVAGAAWPEICEALDLLAAGLPTSPSGDADTDFAAAAGPLLSALAEVCSARAELGGGAGSAVASAVHAAALEGLQAVIDLDGSRANPDPVS